MASLLQPSSRKRWLRYDVLLTGLPVTTSLIWSSKWTCGMWPVSVPSLSIGPPAFWADC